MAEQRKRFEKNKKDLKKNKIHYIFALCSLKSLVAVANH
jgi:hypothetical protein